SAGAELLIRLGLLSGDAEREPIAENAMSQVAPHMAASPTGFGQWLCALDVHLGPSKEIAIVGDPGAGVTAALIAEVTRERYLPNAVLAVASAEDVDPQREVGLLRDRPMVGGRPTAYVCHRFECKLPVTDPHALAEQL